MYSERSIGQVGANIIGGVASVHPTINITNIIDGQSPKIRAIRGIDLILGGIHALGADDRESVATGISEGPVDFVRRDS
jgi:hypothetical protein